MLKQRIITAVVLAVTAGLLLFKASVEVWQWAILIVTSIAAWEWSGFAKLSSHLAKGAFSLLCVVVAYLALNTLSIETIAILTALECLLLLYVVLQYQRSEAKIAPKSLLAILAFGLLSVVLFSVAFIRFREAFSAEVLLLSLMVIWAIDTGAYFSGRRFGKTKLAVHVSPGKTWEGVWGGVLLAFVVGIIGLSWVEPALTISILFFATLLSLIALYSVLGDLFESVLKRQAGLKDSGSILPGHGGVLDRVDSLLIAVPMLYLLWSFGSSV